MGRPVILKRCTDCGVERISSVYENSSSVCQVCRPRRGNTGVSESAAARDRLAKERIAKAKACKCGAAAVAKGFCSRCYQQQRRTGGAEPKPARKPGRPFGASADRAGAVEDFLRESAATGQFSEFIASVAPRLPRCMCCHTTSGLAADADGNNWCRECAYYSFACGYCPAHASPVFFPALSENPVPPLLPVEIPQVYTEGALVVDDCEEP